MKEWPVVALLDAADLVNSRAGAYSDAKRYVSTGDVDGTDIVGSQGVTFDSRPTRADLVASAGDVLFARMQATDKVVLVTPETAGNLWSTGFAALRPRPQTHPSWLRFWLLSRSFRDRKDALCSGATQKAITNDGIRKLTISLPPPAEQARIVEILADAEALLGLRRRSDSRMAEVETALFYKTFRTADSTWPTDKLGRLGTLDRGRSRHRPRDEATLYGGPYPFIQTGDVSNSKGRIVTFTQTYSEEGLQQSRLWSAGTLCITIAANIAKTGVLAFEACFPDSVVGFNPGPRVTVEYIQAWLATIQKTLEDGAPQSAQKNINLETLRDLDVVIPPLDVQHRFAASLAELRSVMDAQTLSREHLIGVFDTVLDVAFRGSI